MPPDTGNNPTPSSARTDPTVACPHPQRALPQRADPLAGTLHWFCVRTKRFTERAVSSTLRADGNLEVFCPFLRFKRPRRSGQIWVCEALFPNYLFVRMDYTKSWRLVLSTRGVTKIVSFGGTPSIVPDSIINELRSSVRENETITIEPSFSVGSEVEISQGPLQGIRAIITRVCPARNRINILLQILGAEREVEIHPDQILPEKIHPLQSPSTRPANP